MDEIPWFRRGGETDAAWLAFKTYRDMGEIRTHDAAYLQYLAEFTKQNSSNTTAKTGVKRSDPRAPRHWYQWAAENDWKARVRAFDQARAVEKEEVDRRRHRERLEKAQDDIDRIVDKTVRVAHNTLDSALVALDIPMTHEAAGAATARIRAAMTSAQVSTTLIAEAAGIGEYIGFRDTERDSEQEEED